MTNFDIADIFSAYSKLIDIHGLNSFKAKSLAAAAFSIERLTIPLNELPFKELSVQKGIGDSTAKKISEIINTGTLKEYEELLAATPPSILEMMKIKGLGPKKINAIWKEMQIETVGELLYACKENRLKTFKGFGEKTQTSVMQKIEFFMNSKGRFLFANTVRANEYIKTNLELHFGKINVIITGDYARQLEIIDQLEFVIDASIEEIKNFNLHDFNVLESDESSITFITESGLKTVLHSASARDKYFKAVKFSSSSEFSELLDEKKCENAKNENDVFKKLNLPFIPSYLRETKNIISKLKAEFEPIEAKDIKGLIHCHSNWSDGAHSIEELAEECIKRGFEYIVISDHSKSAFYANGLYEDRIKKQHILIDELNRNYAPFKIFKSIESDILNDGNLDYSNDILSTFDLVIASVHSNLSMDKNKATERLVKAVENPYTRILGHATGRLLLSRNGYEIDYDKIIDACIANNVVVELNAHPNRLDMDWRYLDKVIEKGGLISIDPDAHYLEGFDDINFGVLVAQKAMITAKDNLSSFSLSQFEKFLTQK